MAQNGLGGNIFSGLAIGIGVAILAPVVVPVLARTLKPVAKAAIKGGLMLFEKGRETFAEVSEVVEDLAAEAKAEFEAAKAGAAIVAEAPRGEAAAR